MVSPLRSLLGAALGVALGVVSCLKADPSPCSPGAAGVGDGTELARRLLATGERVDGKPCDNRIETIRDGFALRTAFVELGDAPAPFVDFSRESAILIEQPNVRGVRFVVARGDTVTIGVQGCDGLVPEGCKVEIFSVPHVTARANPYVCQGVSCDGPTGLQGSALVSQ